MNDNNMQELMRESMGVDELLAVMADVKARSTTTPPRIFIVPSAWRRDPAMMKLLDGVEKAGYEVRECQPLEVKRLEVIASGCQPFERKAQWKREQGFVPGRRRVAK